MQLLALASRCYQDMGKPPVFRLIDGVVRIVEETSLKWVLSQSILPSAKSDHSS
jgi:hypothetical protein